MKVKLALLLILLLTTLVSSAFAEIEVRRIRVLGVASTGDTYAIEGEEVGSNSANSSENLNTDFVSGPTTSGGSVYLAYANVGLGLTTFRYKFRYEASSADDGQQLPKDSVYYSETGELKTQFVDFFLVFGKVFSFSLGVGVLKSGSYNSEIKYSQQYKDYAAGYLITVLDTTAKDRTISGTAGFIVLGYNFGHLELLLSYRQTRVKYGVDWKAAGDIATRKVDYTLDSNLWTAGLGIVF